MNVRSCSHLVSKTPDGRLLLSSSFPRAWPPQHVGLCVQGPETQPRVLPGCLRTTRVQAPPDPKVPGVPCNPSSRMLPPGVLLQRALLHKPTRAMRALERALPRVNPAVLGQLARLSESARAERAAVGPPTTCPVNGMVPCQVAGTLECLPTGVTLKGLHLRVGDTVSLQVRHVLEDPGAHGAAVALFLSRSPVGPGLPLSPPFRQHSVGDALGVNEQVVVGPRRGRAPGRSCGGGRSGFWGQASPRGRVLHGLSGGQRWGLGTGGRQHQHPEGG